MIKFLSLLIVFFIASALCVSPLASADELSFSWGEGSSRWSYIDTDEYTPDALRIGYIHTSD